MIEKNKKEDKKIIFLMVAIAYVIFLFIGLHVGTALETESLFDAIGTGLDTAFTHPFDITFGAGTLGCLGTTTLVFLGAMALLYYNEVQHKGGEKNTKGSSKWNTDMDKYNKTYSDPPKSPSHDGEKNMILSQNVYLSMNTRQTMRNNNILVIGGSGAGKSRFMIKPNILQANCNYVITDPAGELLESTGSFLEKQGYEVKVFNLVEMAKSNRYNPFAYIRDDVGVLMMINCLIKNTTPTGASSGDPFWEKSETALLQALVFYLIKYRPKKEHNFTSVMKLLRAAEVDENDANKKSKLDRLFDEVAARYPNSIALKQYLTFKMGAGKTLKSILISTSVRLTVFNMKQIENLTKADDIDLGSMGFGKKALFVIIPAADSTYNFLVSMMYSQLFETLYFVAETDTKRCPGKRLPSHVRFLLDEFANIGEIPEFTKKLATMRKYEISCTIVLQNLAQIKTMYKDEWESIMGNCDTLIFLGGQEWTTLETISKKLGFRTARTVNVSHTFSKQGSSSRNAGEEKVPLMDEAKLQTMPTDECIVIIRGLDPFHDKKYDYPKHPKYALTGDADKNLIYENKRDNTRPSTEAEKKEVIEEADEKADMVYVAGICNAINSKSPLIQVISEPLDKKEIIKELSDMPTSRFIKIDNHTTAVINAIQVEDGFASLDGIQEKERIYTEAEIVSRDEDDGPAEPAESEDDTDFSDFDSKPIFVDE